MDRYQVTHGKGFKLADHDPGADSGVPGKTEGRAEVAALTARLDELQEMLYADGRYKLLVVLQGMDTSGKGGAIRKVFEGVDPAGVHVASFKSPTEEELSHHFLWRIGPHTPGNGHISIFDRSHYEDVLIVRVRGLVPKARWKARYNHIRNYETMLADEGTIIRKFFLHISKDEQRERLQARLDEPRKRWKFRLSDLDARAEWAAYQAAYTEVLERTSTEHAPWHVIPADKKWYRDWAVATIMIATLDAMDLTWPEPEDDIAGIVID
jgi:PPK2 family polyphosphate:nucleotide phosphotransferase